MDERQDLLMNKNIDLLVWRNCYENTRVSVLRNIQGVNIQFQRNDRRYFQNQQLSLSTAYRYSKRIDTFKGSKCSRSLNASCLGVDLLRHPFYFERKLVGINLCPTRMQRDKSVHKINNRLDDEQPRSQRPWERGWAMNCSTFVLHVCSEIKAFIK